MASTTPVCVDPPGEGSGRRARINGKNVGTAFDLHDLPVFLQQAGLEDWDDLDVARSSLIEWRGAGLWTVT
ncbi:hypothetical protein [Streptomyces canus]|uniref:hypothetical protein n=1 Tax=Streptomyces canus TaxID=58343 RepID=UPI0037241679